jgi:hypothetical protein
LQMRIGPRFWPSQLFGHASPADPGACSRPRTRGSTSRRVPKIPSRFTAESQSEWRTPKAHQRDQRFCRCQRTTLV